MVCVKVRFCRGRVISMANDTQEAGSGGTWPLDSRVLPGRRNHNQEIRMSACDQRPIEGGTVVDAWLRISATFGSRPRCGHTSIPHCLCGSPFARRVVR